MCGYQCDEAVTKTTEVLTKERNNVIYLMLTTSWLKSSLKKLEALQQMFWELFTTDTISLQGV